MIYMYYLIVGICIFGGIPLMIGAVVSPKHSSLKEVYLSGIGAITGLILIGCFIALIFKSFKEVFQS